MKKNDIVNGFTIFVALATVLTIALNMINNRFNPGDFMVYYTATGHLFSGEPVYLVSFYTGSGFYKYSPATLFFFLPYLGFSFKTASVIHILILGGAYLYTMIIIRQLTEAALGIENVRHKVFLLSISFACILIHFTRELYLGNINILLLMCCCLAIRDFLSGKQMQAGILLGIVILAKPYLLILVLPLVLRRKWRALGWLMGTVGTGLILPFIYPGPMKGIALYGDWINSVMLHGEGFPGMTSLDFMIRLLLPAWPAWGIYAIFISCCALICLFILENLKREKLTGFNPGLTGMNFTFEWFLLIALLPNLIKTDWVLMVFSAPLIVFIIFYIAGTRHYWWIPVLFIILFFYGANSDDLLGRELSRKILHSGLMGLGNFLLVLVAIFMFLDHRKQIKPSKTSLKIPHLRSGEPQ